MVIIINVRKEVNIAFEINDNQSSYDRVEKGQVQ